MNDLRMDRKGIYGNISWSGIVKIIRFLAREWRTISLGIAILVHAAWNHIGQVKQDRNIAAQDNNIAVLQKDDVEFKKAVANCIITDPRK